MSERERESGMIARNGSPKIIFLPVAELVIRSV